MVKQQNNDLNQDREGLYTVHLLDDDGDTQYFVEMTKAKSPSEAQEEIANMYKLPEDQLHARFLYKGK
jgi:hypothetical protein